MASSFSQQLRYLKRHEPALYESISKVYRKCLMESNLAPEMDQTDDEAAETPVEKTEIKQTSTKGVDDLMSKVHAMVGVNENKKEGEEIFDTSADDVETVKPDPQQQAELFGETAPDETIPEEAPTEEAPSTNPGLSTGELDLDNLFTEDIQDGEEPEIPLEGTETEQPAEQPAEEPAEEPANF